MKTRLAAAFAALCLATAAPAADPTAVIATPGISFAEYSSPTPVGQGQVDTSTLFFIDELTGVLGTAWYVFFDPKGPGDIAATITFASAITGCSSPRRHWTAPMRPMALPASTTAPAC